MAIAFGTAGTAVTGTTSLSPVVPSTASGGDLLVLMITGKYPANLPITPAGWTLKGTYSGGQGSSGASSGNAYVQLYTKISDGTEGGSTVSITVTGGNVCIAKIDRWTKAANTNWLISSAVGGSQNTATTAWSITFDADPGITTNDVVLVCCGYNAAGTTYSAESLSTTGITYGSVTERVDTVNASGDRCGMFGSSHPVTSGTSSAAPVYTAIASASSGNEPAGAAIAIRLRESSVTHTPTFGAAGTAANGTTSVNPAYPTGISAGDILFLHIAGKYPPNTPTTPSGWALLDSASTSAGTPGADNGPVWCYIYKKIATGSESGNIGSVTVTSGNCVTARVIRYTPSNTAHALSFATTNGIQDAEATSVSIAFGADPVFTTADLAIFFMAQNSDISTTWSSVAETASGTAVWSSITQQSNIMSTTSGDQVGGRMWDSVIQSGTSTGAPTITASLGTSMSVAGVLIRVREILGSPRDGGTWQCVWEGVNQSIW